MFARISKCPALGKEPTPLLFVTPFETTLPQILTMTLRERCGQLVFGMSRLRLGAGKYFAQSQPGVGRLGPDLFFFFPAGGARSQPLKLLNLDGGWGAQEGCLSTSSGLGPDREASCFIQASCPASCLSPEPSLGKAQRPDSLVHLPNLRPRPCHSWWAVLSGRGCAGSGAQGHTKRASVTPVIQ